ncbi:MAG: hypothetical protein MK074_06895 [Phycisphaerales bacterium]|nr:hypothetical protein [Phycisphaerales bacterium]
MSARSTRRSRVTLAAVMLAMAMASVLVGFWQSVEAIALQPVHEDRATSIHVDRPGVVLLWKDVARSGEDGRDIDLPDLALTSVDGATIALGNTARRITFARPDPDAPHGTARWQTVGRWDVPDAGTWTGAPLGAGWAWSPDPIDTVKWWSLGSIALAIVLVGIAAALAWIALRPVDVRN